MKAFKPILILAGLLAACSTSRAVSVAAGPFYNNDNGHTYYLLSPTTWTNAELFAETLGGHLATINDAAENTWVYNNVNILPHPVTGEYNAWIGLYNLDFPSGTWQWTSGEAVTYLNWAPGEPNFDFEHWVHYGGPPGSWNNLYWDNQLYAVAEVPEPATWSLGAVAMIGAIIRRRLFSRC